MAKAVIVQNFPFVRRDFGEDLAYDQIIFKTFVSGIPIFQSQFFFLQSKTLGFDFSVAVRVVNRVAVNGAKPRIGVFFLLEIFSFLYQLLKEMFDRVFHVGLPGKIFEPDRIQQFSHDLVNLVQRQHIAARKRNDQFAKFVIRLLLHFLRQ